MWVVYLLHRECYERALEIYKKVCGHEHPSVAMVLINLGSLWKEEGDKAKAVILYLEALTIQQDVLGHNHLEVSHHSLIKILML